jgi:hypothetical protein
MARLCPLALFLVLAILAASPALAETKKAAELRKANELIAHDPPADFLAGFFVADEISPALVFGPVREFVKTRACPTAWLIEKGEKDRLDARKGQPGPLEYTLYLEEDCPGRVTYYLFVDRSDDPKQWLQWRWQFHKSKAEPEYGATQKRLERAAADGMTVGSELRFVAVDGELSPGSPEKLLQDENKLAPLYDLVAGKKLGR